MAASLTLRARGVSLTRAQFADRAFAFGVADCVQTARFLIEACGGVAPSHRPYASRFGALRALKEAGAVSIEALVTTHCAPLAPAAAILGDLLAFDGEGEGPLDACALGFLGAGSAFAWREGRLAALSPSLAIAAWRTPCPKL